MALVPCNPFSWKLPKATRERDIGPRRHKRPDDGQESMPCGKGQGVLKLF